MSVKCSLCACGLVYQITLPFSAGLMCSTLKRSNALSFRNALTAVFLVSNAFDSPYASLTDKGRGLTGQPAFVYRGKMISTLSPIHATLPVFKNILRVNSDNMFHLLRGETL